VRSKYYAGSGPQTDAPPILVVGPVSFDGAAPGSAPLAPALAPFYEQMQQAPDAARPATLVRRREAARQPERTSVNALGTAQLWLVLPDSRSPSFRPLEDGPLVMQSAWSGTIRLPSLPSWQSIETEVAPRVDVFGVPAFRFDDVEAIGFRIDLPRNAATRLWLQRLVRPLNFHRMSGDPSQVPDFRYEPQGASLVIELLRYGQMRLMRQDAPLTSYDYQSQHELVVRVVVGRVDDDSSNAREQAVFVPAIFVDNPWSKIVGRDIQGIPKVLAAFCVDGQGKNEALESDGRMAGRPGEPPRPLDEVKSIRLRDTWGAAPGNELLRIDCRPSWCDGWDAFQDVSPGAAIAGLSLGGADWRWFDLDRLSYLAAFLARASGQVLNGFRSVQSAPLGVQPLGRAWVTGRFQVDDIVQLAFPLGTVGLTFNAPGNAPASWLKLCRLLPVRDYLLHVTSWYRLKFGMTMYVDDGLTWT
jgi:hypothetical protein